MGDNDNRPSRIKVEEVFQSFGEPIICFGWFIFVQQVIENQLRSWGLLPVASFITIYESMSTSSLITKQLKETAAQLLRFRQDAGQNGLRYGSLEEFVLKYGKLYKTQRLPSTFRRGQFKLCFSNSMTMAERNADKLIYVEGFAYAPVITPPHPVLHAWCVDQTGTVYDRTWGFDGSREYFGIPFKLSFVRKMHRLTNTYGVLEQGVPGWTVYDLEPEIFLSK